MSLRKVDNEQTTCIPPPKSTKSQYKVSSQASPKSGDKARPTGSPSTSKEVHPSTKLAPNKPSLSAAVNRLKSENPRKIVEALVLIRKVFIKEKTGPDRLRHYGGVESLLSIIAGDNVKQADIALSIMGNICLDVKVQKKVQSCDGIAMIGEVVKKSENKDIINRACRTLANLGQNPECCMAIHDVEGVVEAMVKQLNICREDEDDNLQLTLIRTIRILSATSGHRQAVVEEEGLRAVAFMLKSPLLTVIKAAFHAINILSKKFTDDCARQLTAADAPSSVIRLSDHEDEEIRRTSLSLLLLQWMTHEHMRVSIGNAGGVTFIMETIPKVGEKRKKLILANALCLCCYEVVNRVRVRENGGLELMLGFLQDPDFSQLHDRCISALACFLYDDDGFEILLKKGLVGVVIEQLRRVAKLNDIPQELQTEYSGDGDDEKDVTLTETIIDSDEEHPSFDTNHPESETKAEITEDSIKDTQEPLAEESSVTSAKKENIGYKGTRLVTIHGEDNKGNLDLDSKMIDHKTGHPKGENREESTFQVPLTKVDKNKEPEANVTKEEPDAGKSKNIPRYSIDSPTYKSVVEWQMEDYQGPKNVLGSQIYYDQLSNPSSPSSYASPPHPGPFSPLSISSYGSYDGSPGSSPRPLARSHSPDLDSPSMSPGDISSGSYSDLDSPSLSPVRLMGADDSKDVMYSPQTSPTILPEAPSPLFFADKSREWMEKDVFDSSDEEDDKEGLFGMLKKEVQRENQDLLDLETLSLPSNMLFPSLDSGSELEHKSSKSARMTPVSSKKGTKRKRELTPEMRKKILLSVEKSSQVASPSIDLNEMLSSKILDAKKDEKIEKEVPTDRKDVKKQVEYCLVMLLKRISYGSDPGEHLINFEVSNTILDYVTLAHKPLNKCGRILIRIAKNPNCFEKILQEMVPALVYRKVELTSKANNGTSTNKAQHIPLKGSEPMHRSLSACTLDETPKARKFHEEVMKKAGTPTVHDNLRDNKKDCDQMKETFFSTLALVAESPFGCGVIDHILQTGTDTEKARLVVSLAFVCRSRPLLGRIYMENNGFCYLLSAIQQERNAFLQNNALQALKTLVLNHVKEPPSQPKVSIQTPAVVVSATTSLPQGPQDSDVVFTFDDGTSLTANRALLCEKSDYFAAMLHGHYSESMQSNIRIPGVEKDVFKIIINHLDGKETTQVSKIQTKLEAYKWAHRYMLHGLLERLEVEMVDKHMTADEIMSLAGLATQYNSSWLFNSCLWSVIVKENREKCDAMLKGILNEITDETFSNLFK